MYRATRIVLWPRNGLTKSIVDRWESELQQQYLIFESTGQGWYWEGCLRSRYMLLENTNFMAQKHGFRCCFPDLKDLSDKSFLETSNSIPPLKNTYIEFQLMILYGEKCFTITFLLHFRQY